MTKANNFTDEFDKITKLSDKATDLRNEAETCIEDISTYRKRAIALRCIFRVSIPKKIEYKIKNSQVY